MTLPEHESFLPKVEEDDLLELVFEEVTSSDHYARWLALRTTNPTLAREILKRAALEAYLIDKKNITTLELQKMIIDHVSFAVAALTQAAKRHNKLEPSVTNADVDDEDQQP